MKIMEKLLLIFPLILLLFVGCSGRKKNIPFIPIDNKNVTKIEINASIRRCATNTEIDTIISLINEVPQFDTKLSLNKYGNGRPDPINIQIFTNDSRNTNYCFILPYNDEYILISQPQSKVGYLVKNKSIREYFK